jgi:hypothetical protein
LELTEPVTLEFLSALARPRGPELFRLDPDSLQELALLVGFERMRHIETGNTAITRPSRVRQVELL